MPVAASSSRVVVHLEDHSELYGKFYVYEDEEVAARSVKSKNFITKVMFLAAVARPRYNPSTKVSFDGKIGVWPFDEVARAIRGSKNRSKGAPVTVPKNVNGTVYKAFILGRVVPAIIKKFPPDDLSRGVRIQQDNASPHRQVTTVLRAAGVENIGDESSVEGALLQLGNRLGEESHLEKLVNSQEAVDFE
ncbi:hypothetical protein H257_09298 [Aphanomyces astaci]|uniref:Uncharacterized protein n=1 Tax=Aphanomyces astaci TaxID=112090 RepID=W4GAZ5_APHAT|nr:hypothetical protein H257_09298 [Aphanomyces astaci]ETV76862.1 hypothetical protein H257_09298 [Aphanomyces astaci]|eukprot:XP_009833774.1 hypothetical protein H257_09298 [Aphanomyces astaci]